MNIKDLIKNAIINNKTLTLSDLEQRAEKRGVSLDELYDALEAVGRDKRIKRSVKGDDVVYKYAPPKKKTPELTAEWYAEHYPWPGKNGVPEFKMPFPEWSLAWMFLSPEDMLEYKQSLNPSLRFKRRYLKR